jgi:alanine-synthesizing transaminase
MGLPSEPMTMQQIRKATKLNNVSYDIRGPVMARARAMEEDGISIMKLNIGNVSVFGLEPPDDIVQHMIRNLPEAAAYTDSQGLLSARKAIMQYSREKGIADVSASDIYIGNGASELIVMAMNALLNTGDEVLLPAPDYPLYTSAVTLSGGTPVHYMCDEQSDWMPDIDDIKRKVTANTKAIVIINPNNPTGALYPREVLEQIIEVARQHQLIVFADEIYDKTLYENHTHLSIASLATDVLFFTFNGLSKNYRSCGYRAGWMVISGEKRHARDYLDGLLMLASMRLCANTPGQLAIAMALNSYQCIDDLVKPDGRLGRQRDVAYELVTSIPGVSCVKPKAALYLFPRLDPRMYPIQNDQQFIMELLETEKVLLVQGTGFNWPTTDHFRLVFLPNVDDLERAIGRIARFLEGYRKRYSS